MILFHFSLFYYDAKKNASSVLLDGLWFANGVAISPNEDFVVVSETGRSQIRRYYIKGPKKGTDDIFVDGLPGMSHKFNKTLDCKVFMLMIIFRNA